MKHAELAMDLWLISVCLVMLMLVLPNINFIYMISALLIVCNINM